MNREKLPEYIFSMFPLIHKKLLKKHPDSIVSKQQMTLLHKIKFKPDRPMSFYCQQTMISKPNMSKMVNVLIEDNYVIRKRAEDDRRIVTLHLSEKGKDLVNKYIKDMSNQIMESAKALSDDEVDRLVESFETIFELLSRLNTSSEKEAEEDEC